MSQRRADAERTEAFSEAGTLCTRLRERGDEISLDAAAMIEGTLDAFADLVDGLQNLRDRNENLERNLRSAQELWARVPAEHRIHAANR
jgi:hypothetical protein